MRMSDAVLLKQHHPTAPCAGAAHAVLQALLRKYVPIIVVAAFVLLYTIYRIFLR